MASGAEGKCGVLQMAFEKRGNRSILSQLYRQTPLLVQQALYWDEALPELPCVYIVTTSGCVLQGDRFDISINLAASAMAHITTQSATKIHTMDANYAAQTQQIVLGDNAYLEYLPGPTIPHKHSRFITHTHVTLESSATFLYSEILMPGRTHHGDGEVFQYDLYSSTLSAERPGGQALFTEKFVIKPWAEAVGAVGVMGRYHVLGNVMLVTPKENADRIFEQITPETTTGLPCVASVGRLPNDAGLVYKILGTSSQHVQAKVRHFWQVTRRQVLAVSIPPVPVASGPRRPARSGPTGPGPR